MLDHQYSFQYLVPAVYRYSFQTLVPAVLKISNKIIVVIHVEVEAPPYPPSQGIRDLLSLLRLSCF